MLSRPMLSEVTTEHKILPESACPGLLEEALKAQECRTVELRPLLSISPGCDCDDGCDAATSI